MADLIILALIAGGTLLGYIRGFVRSAVNLVSFFAAYYLAFKFYDDLAPKLKSWFPLTKFESYSHYSFLAEALKVDQVFYNAVAFGVIFFLTKFGLTWVGGFLDLFARLPIVATFNSFGGLLLGFLEVLLITIIAVNVAAVLPWKEANDQLSQSVIANYLIENVPIVADKLHEIWKMKW